MIIRFDYYGKILHIQEIGQYHYIIDKQELFYHGINALRIIGHPINIHKKIIEVLSSTRPLSLDLSFIYKGHLHKRYGWMEIERDPEFIKKGSVAVIQAHKVKDDGTV